MKPRFISRMNCLKLGMSFGLALATSIGINIPARAVQFRFFHSEDTPQEVIDGFKRAGDIWSSKLNDDVTLDIYISFGTPSNINALGAARPNMVQVDYDSFLKSSFRDITSEDDLLAFKNLQSNPNPKNLYDNLINLDIDQFQEADIENVTFSDSIFNMLVNNDLRINYVNRQNLNITSLTTMLDNNNNINNRKIWLTRANAKALGLISDEDDNNFDANIIIKNDYSNWDFSRVENQNATIAEDKYDFLSVALHEIGHSLGFSSGVDVLKSLLYSELFSDHDNLQSLFDSIMQDNDITENEIAYVTSMDLFRCSNTSKNNGVFDLSVGTQTYFSIDACNTNLGNFTRGLRHQASHWSEKSTFPMGIMHPTLAKGQILNISDLDLQFLDVVGWDIELGSENSSISVVSSEEVNSYNSSFNQEAEDNNLTPFISDYSYWSNGFSFW